MDFIWQQVNPNVVAQYNRYLFEEVVRGLFPLSFWAGPSLERALSFQHLPSRAPGSSLPLREPEGRKRMEAFVACLVMEHIALTYIPLARGQLHGHI